MFCIGYVHHLIVSTPYMHESLILSPISLQTPKSTEDELQSLFCLRAEIRISTSSMTSVPKPLKFLRDHFTKLEEVYTKMSTSPSKGVLADILSVLAMAVEDTENKCIKYRLEGSSEKVSSFGHPYIRLDNTHPPIHTHTYITHTHTHTHTHPYTHTHRRLCTQIPDFWNSSSSPEDNLMGLVRDICVYCLEHSAEAEACDLLMEIEKISFIIDLVTEDIHERVCLYLTRFAFVCLLFVCLLFVY